MEFPWRKQSRTWVLGFGRPQEHSSNWAKPPRRTPPNGPNRRQNPRTRAVSGARKASRTIIPQGSTNQEMVETYKKRGSWRDRLESWENGAAEGVGQTCSCSMGKGPCSAAASSSGGAAVPLVPQHPVSGNDAIRPLNMHSSFIFPNATSSLFHALVLKLLGSLADADVGRD